MNGRVSVFSFHYADAGFFMLLNGTDANLQRIRSPGLEPAAMANREAAICFSFWPRVEASMTATLFSPVTQLRPVFVRSQEDECFELLQTKNSKPRRLTVP